MNLADVFIFLFVILGFVIVFIAYWLMATGLFPGFVERSAERLGRAPIKAALLGAVIGVPVVLLGGAMTKAPNGAVKLLGIVVAFLPLLIALFGSAGLALRIGQGLVSSRDAQEPWRRTLRGGVVLALSFVLPGIGWFAVLPFALVTGFGVFLQALFTRQSVSALVPPPVPAHPLPPVLPQTAPFQP